MSEVDRSSQGRRSAPSTEHRPEVCVVATVRNEAPYLLEWLAHHRAIGVTRFLVYSNDCEDGTDEMLDRAQELGLITHVRNRFPEGASPQRFALNRAVNSDLVQSSDWALHIDLDEFVQVETGDGSIAALVHASAPSGAISLVSRLYGSSGQRDFQDQPVMERFQYASRILPRSIPNDTEIKTLFRPSLFRRINIHNPAEPKLKLIQDRDIRWRNGSADDITEAMLHDPGPPRFGALNPDYVGFDLAWIAHFCVKSRSEFLLKRLRGSAEPAARAQRRYSDVYWSRRDNNTLHFPARMGRGAAEQRDALHADPVLGALHRDAVACWEGWIRDRLITEEAITFLDGKDQATEE